MQYDFKQLINDKDFDKIIEICEETPPPSVAELISTLEDSTIYTVLSIIKNIDVKSEIFTYLPIDHQIQLSKIISKSELADIITNMSPDDRVDLYKKSPDEIKDLLTRHLARAEREDIIKLSSYSERTAGAVMTSDYAALLADFTINEAIDHLRKEAPDKETIYYAYVIDHNRHLIGSVSLRELILAPSYLKVKDIMATEVIFANINDDQEDIAKKIEKFDLIAIPVVDDSNVLLGIVTHDDAFDIIRQEQTEDVEKMMGITGYHQTGVYLKTPSLTHFKNRVTWIVILAFLGSITAMVVHRFENVIQQLTILTVYMPLLTETGGNTGSQSATVVIRALALGELSYRDIPKVLFKEFKISFLLAIILALFILLRVYIFNFENSSTILTLDQVAIIVSAAIAIQTISATLLGALLPLIVNKLKLDPALIASPALTTIVDISGLLIYLSIAQFFLNNTV